MRMEKLPGVSFTVQIGLLRGVSFLVADKPASNFSEWNADHVKSQRMENAPVLIKGGLLGLESSLPLIRRRKDISRGADELRERKRGQCESPFKGCANMKPNNLKSVQEGIKATCYFEWLLNLLSGSEICNEIQPLPLITSCCNWTSTIKEYFLRVFLEQLRIFASVVGCFWALIFPGKLFFFFFLKSERLMSIRKISGILLECLVHARRLIYIISTCNKGPMK